MIVDVAAFIGNYPFRHSAPGTPDELLGTMDRLGIDRAWVGHLPSVLYRDPAPGTAALVAALAPHADRLHAVPTVRAGFPGWRDDVDAAARRGAPAVRAYPMWQDVDPSGRAMRELTAACAAHRLPLHLTVRFEDARQRHPLDRAPDLPAAAVRTLAREDGARLLVSNADRAFIEEVHFGLTPGEAARVLWDFAWIWGPPEDHLALLLETVGVERFTLGTGTPLRLADASFAQLDLLDITPDDRLGLTGGNLMRWR